MLPSASSRYPCKNRIFFFSLSMSNAFLLPLRLSGNYSEANKPDRIPCTKSHNMDTTSSGVIVAKASIITGLSLKEPAQRLWPRDRAKTTVSARTTVSLRVTAMACFARVGFPAPNSLDTLVLQERTWRYFKENRRIDEFREKEIIIEEKWFLILWLPSCST